MPHRLLSPWKHSFSSAHLSLLLLELIYPELCLLLDKTHREGKHAEASENAAAVLSGLSFTVGHCVIG